MGVKRGCQEFMYLLIQTHSFNKYFMNSHYEPGTVMTRTSMALAPTELRDSQCGRFRHMSIHGHTCCLLVMSDMKA